MTENKFVYQTFKLQEPVSNYSHLIVQNLLETSKVFGLEFIKARKNDDEIDIELD